MSVAYPIAPVLAGAAATYVAAMAASSGLARLGFYDRGQNGRIGCVDGLRGYLAVSVLIHHFICWMQVVRLGPGWTHPTITFFDQLGAGSVALFFMITGFVFYPKILAGWRATPWLAVLTRRLFRLQPMVLLSLAIVVVMLMRRTGSRISAADALALTQWATTWREAPLFGDTAAWWANAGVLWSLWYEWVFYLLILPAAALAMDLARDRLPTWVIPIAIILVGLPSRLTGQPSSVMHFMPLFGAGMLAFEISRSSVATAALRTPAASWIAVASLLIGTTLLPSTTLFGFVLFTFFFTCVACGNDLGGALSTRAADILAECSFGIYLLHGCLLSVLFVDVAPPLPAAGLPVFMPFAGVAALLLAAATCALVERPAIRFGRRVLQASLCRRSADRVRPTYNTAAKPSWESSPLTPPASGF